MDREIEERVRQCVECQRVQSSPPLAPLHSWEWPLKPWSRVHCDFAGPFLGHMFLIVIDAHSKWIEAHQMSSITSTVTIQHLRDIFAQHGLSETIVTDNGTSFVSEEFKQFLEENGISHIRSSPHHSASNGLAEKAVQIFKQGLKKHHSGNSQDRISKLLFHYRLTPHSTTGLSPAELLCRRKFTSRLDLLFPNLSNRVKRKQELQELYHDNGTKYHKFEEGEAVFVKNFGNGELWIPGFIVRQFGPISYHVQLEGKDIIWRCHVDHVRNRALRPPYSMTTSVKNDHSETITATQPELLPQITVHPEDCKEEDTSRRYPSWN